LEKGRKKEKGGYFEIKLNPIFFPIFFYVNKNKGG